MSHNNNLLFEDTYNKMLDCEESLADFEDLDWREEVYKDKMIRLCKKIVDDYFDEDIHWE